MDKISTDLKDVFILSPKVYEDDRGYFFESFNKKFLDIDFVQDNESKSDKDVLRGLHYQLAPFSQAKLLRVIKGSILDVVVDLRRSSPSFKKHICVKLSEFNKKQIFIPKGFAHGFLTLEDNTICSYKVDEYYNKDYETGIRYDDDALGIAWGVKNPVLSLKDISLPSFLEAKLFE